MEASTLVTLIFAACVLEISFSLGNAYRSRLSGWAPCYFWLCVAALRQTVMPSRRHRVISVFALSYPPQWIVVMSPLRSVKSSILWKSKFMPFFLAWLFTLQQGQDLHLASRTFSLLLPDDLREIELERSRRERLCSYRYKRLYHGLWMFIRWRLDFP